MTSAIMPLVLMACALALFYAIPLFDPGSSIQWDALDVHYSAQRYLADELRAGRLPLWTPYLYAGFPFLADPQVGAFYPLNWPFVLGGAGPKLIQAEIALHGGLAMLGTFLFLRLMGLNQWPAALAAITYALSGYFAGHASHVGMVQAASLLPWLLWCGERALRGPWLRWLGAAGGAGGLLFLIGHLQTALYSCVAFALYVGLRVLQQRHLAWRGAGLLAGVALLAFLIAAVMVLPGLELAQLSIRSTQDYSASDEGILHPAALATLVFPDALGARGEQYRGPGDRTQFYFYAGLLLLPLAAYGAVRWKAALLPLCLTGAAIWFMLGPAAGFYRLAMVVPWMSQVRAPVHAWFVVAFALAWLAALGLERAGEKLSWKGLGLAVCLVMSADLAMINSWNNPLTYSREGFDVLHQRGADVLRTRVAPTVAAGMRFAAVDQLAAFGSMNSPLQVRLETTYGYNPLELRRYAAYRKVAEESAGLLDALCAAVALDLRTARLVMRPSALPKAWFPATVRQTESEPQELEELKTLDPRREALVSTAFPGSAREAAITGIEVQAADWRIGYRAGTGGLLVLSLPHFPGWTATVNGEVLPVHRVNHALTGVDLPAGEHQLHMRFRSSYLSLGAALSLGGLLLAGILFWYPARTQTR